MSNNIPPTIDTKIIYNNFFQIRQDTLSLNDETHYEYYSLITSPVAIMILASALDGRFIINKEYRHPTGKFLLSCPGGIKKKEEAVLEGAKRELLEETGWTAENFQIIGQAYPFAGISSQKTYYVRAKNAYHLQSPQLEPAEILETHLLTEKELYHLITNGEEVDGLLCTAFFFNQLCS